MHYWDEYDPSLDISRSLTSSLLTLLGEVGMLLSDEKIDKVSGGTDGSHFNYS